MNNYRNNKKNRFKFSGERGFRKRSLNGHKTTNDFNSNSVYLEDGEFPEFFIYDPNLDSSYPASVTPKFPFVNFEIYHVDMIASVSDDWFQYGYIMGDINIDYMVDVVDLTNQIGFILDFHSPDHSSCLLGIKYSGPMSKRPAEDGFLLLSGCHSFSLGPM